MTFREGLIAARSHIVFILALLCASALVMWLDQKSDLAGSNATPEPIPEHHSR